MMMNGRQQVINRPVQYLYPVEVKDLEYVKLDVCPEGEGVKKEGVKRRQCLTRE